MKKWLGTFVVVLALPAWADWQQEHREAYQRNAERYQNEMNRINADRDRSANEMFQQEQLRQQQQQRSFEVHRDIRQQRDGYGHRPYGQDY